MNVAARTLRSAGHQTHPPGAPHAPNVTLVLAAMLVVAAVALMFALADSRGHGGEQARVTWEGRDSTSVEATPHTLEAGLTQRDQSPGVNGPGARP
jgi:hypothetical protein